jgi:ankyrin repeat protein
MRMTVTARLRHGVMALLALTSLGAGAAAPQVADAVKARDLAAVSALLEKSADVNVPQPDGTTALHWAAYWDDVATVRLLLRAGANVNAANRYGVTPLFVAATNGNAPVLETLLKAKADANTATATDAVSGAGEPALMAAARTGNAEAVKLLLEYGADVRAGEGWHKQTALMYAAAANSPAAVQALLDAGADIRATSDGGFTPLHYAARAGAIDTARVLVAAGADLNKRLNSGASPLMLGIINARWELAAMLVEKGANPNDDGMGFTALHQLVWAYHPNVVYMPPGPVPTGKLGAMDLAKVLLDHKADPNARMTKNPPDGYRTSMNRIGATPLLMAARVPDVDLMRLLLSYGADPGIKTKDNTTLLIVASGYGWQAGESPDAKPGALMEAVKLAIELGGDVNEANDRGYTPLHCAVIRESNELIQFLVDQGADLSAKTAEEDPRTPGLGEGKTPLGVSQGQLINATKKYYPEQEKYLRRIMGLPTPTQSADAPQ